MFIPLLEGRSSYVTSRYRFACPFFIFLAVTASVSGQTESTAPTIAVQMEQAVAQNRTHFSARSTAPKYKFLDREDGPEFKSVVVAEITALPPNSKKYTTEETNGSGWGEKIF